MTTLADLWKPFHEGPLPAFAPAARYIAPMDCLIYLREDVSYRAVRLKRFTTVLLHPYEDRAIGVKVKGVRHLYERMNAILTAYFRSQMPDRPAEIALATLWEVALTAGGEREVANAEAERQKMLTRDAREIVSNAEPIAVFEIAEALETA
jgi:hypothetical protein